MDGGPRWRRTALLAAGLAATACGGERPDAPAPPDSVASAREAPVAEMAVYAPDSLGWNQTDSVRVVVRTRGRDTLAPGALHVGAAAGLALEADSSRAARVEAGLRFPLRALAPGLADSAAFAVRMPPAPPGGAAPPGGYAIRLALPERGIAREHLLRVRAGSERVAGGCATTERPAVQRYGVGPVRVGMSARALRAACPEASDTTWQGEGARERGLVVRPGGRPVVALLSGDSVVRVEVADSAVRTAAGPGVGSRVMELRARYGRPCGGQGEGVVALWFQNAPGISFLLDTADLRRVPAQLPDSARVMRILVHGADTPCSPIEDPR